MARITVLGTGAWGIALAMLLNDNGHDVTMWSAFDDEVKMLSVTREHKKLLPGVIIPSGIEFTNDISFTAEADTILLAVPSFAISSVCESLKPYLSKQIIINAGKGLEGHSHLRFTQLISKVTGMHGIVAISGPTHAEEVSRKVPTSIVAASEIHDNALYAQDLLMSSYMRVYVNDDVIGVELGGALKNIIALCTGILDGMGLGDNTKAALMTRGLAEITRLGVALGGKPETFMGLAGMGDLIVTCCSAHSRNHSAGVLIGSGMSANEAIEKIGTVEGYYALTTAFELSKKVNIEMPIVNECYKIFIEGLDAKKSIDNLMCRPKKSEIG